MASNTRIVGDGRQWWTGADNGGSQWQMVAIGSGQWWMMTADD